MRHTRSSEHVFDQLDDNVDGGELNKDRRIVLLIVAGVVVLATGAALLYRTSLAANPVDAIAQGQFRQAAKLLEKPAQSGSVTAQTTLGNLYYLGLGVKRDMPRAFRLYEMAAMSGNSSAQYNYALFHLHGYGVVAVDHVKAAAWLLIADDGGVLRAPIYLRNLSGMMNPNKIQAAERLKAELQRKITRDNL